LPRTRLGGIVAAVTAALPHRPALVLLLLASTLGVMAGAMLMPVLEAIRSDLGVSGTAAGLIITMHGLAIAVASPLAGWMIDRWGVRMPLAVGLLIYGLAGSAGMLTDTYAALIVTRAFFGIGAALVFTGTTVAIITLYPGLLRDRVMGWRTTASSLGGVVFPLLGGVLGSLYSWHATFGVYLIGVPVGVAAMLMIPETRPPGRKPAPRGFARLVLRSPGLLGIYAFTFAFAVMLYSVAVFLPQRLAQIGVHAPVLVSLYMVVLAGAASVVGLLYGRLRVHASYLMLMRFGTLGWLGCFLILGVAAHPAPIVVATLLLGTANGLVFSAISVMVAEHAPEGLLGRATGLSSTLMFIGQFASPLMIGPIMAATSITTGYLVVAGMTAIMLAALLRIPDRNRPR
jgi:ACDE family multidrug resistance protein